MTSYTFWNNKGGTGKTSLAFQTICRFADLNRNKNILVIDMCPQANLSELFLGGLEYKGSSNLIDLQAESKRVTIGGYFQDRLPSAYTTNHIDIAEFITLPGKYNPNIPQNIKLICGDPILELQANAVSTLANTQLPGTDTWLKIIDWVKDLIDATNNAYDYIFFDTNPSFSIYTQMALAATNNLILPVMADDSSKRAIQNAFSLIYGFKLPHPIYADYAFSSKLKKSGRDLPKVHLILKNRLTQYMGPASAYNAVLETIEEIVRSLTGSDRNIFTHESTTDMMIDIRDFQTTGVVSFARGCPFFKLDPKNYTIQKKRIQVRADYLQNCKDAIDNIVDKIS